MLQNTFIHADGIGHSTEQVLWEGGAHNWGTFLSQHADRTWRGVRFDRLAKTVEASDSALRRRDVTFFSRRLVPSQHWRLFPTFQQRVAYVDIETTGLFPHADKITVVALYDGERTRTFVRGKNLDKFPAAISKTSLLVTYNGSTFDVPFLRREFRSIRIPPAHLDLRYALGRLGYSGGLKAIEREVGIKRHGGIRDIDGFEAVRLWYRYKRGDRAALKTLVDYAAADVTSLETLAELACRQLARSIGMPRKSS